MSFHFPGEFGFRCPVLGFFYEFSFMKLTDNLLIKWKIQQIWKNWNLLGQNAKKTCDAKNPIIFFIFVDNIATVILPSDVLLIFAMEKFKTQNMRK